MLEGRPGFCNVRGLCWRVVGLSRLLLESARSSSDPDGLAGLVGVVGVKNDAGRRFFFSAAGAWSVLSSWIGVWPVSDGRKMLKLFRLRLSDMSMCCPTAQESVSFGCRSPLTRRYTSDAIHHGSNDNIGVAGWKLNDADVYLPVPLFLTRTQLADEEGKRDLVEGQEQQCSVTSRAIAHVPSPRSHEWD